MPCFRGIELSIVTLPNSKDLPEFPHPDASSVELSSASRAPESDATRIHKANARISVYVPSLPGAQFCLRYALRRPPEPHCYLYFKLFVNGRSIASWGLDPAVRLDGSVTQALYEPCERWHYKENGIVLRREGIESRHFYFLPTPDARSVADDGGLIEVQVFRSRGRRRRAPSLLQYRNQETYGIASPSAGLLESPEGVCYYDWILRDPKDSPFAVFRFHYRSWHNLGQLSLMPDPDSLSEDARSALPTPETTIGSSSLPTKRTEPVREASAAYHGRTESAKGPGAYEWRPAKCPSALPSPALVAAHAVATRLAPPRPLPEIPTMALAPRKSCDSTAPSIAPSLLPYIEGNSIEEVELGTATKIDFRLGPDPAVVEDGYPRLPTRPNTSIHGRKMLRKLTAKSWPLGPPIPSVIVELIGSPRSLSSRNSPPPNGLRTL